MSMGPWLEGWQASCSDFAQQQQLDARHLRILEAFGSSAPNPRESLPFEELFQRALGGIERLGEGIVERLVQEVDRGQAEMFARRFASVIGLLQEQAHAHPEARLYCVGLLSRLDQLLQAPGPQVLRVRAICDFYYSHAALLHHAQHAGEPLEAMVAGLRWRDIAPHVALAKLEGQSAQGPVHVHILRAKGARLQMLDCRESPLSFPEQLQQRGAIAGVSGGFFLYSETDIEAPSRRTDPVGLLLSQGQLHNPPIFHRASLLQSEGGGLAIEVRGMRGVSLAWDEGQLKIEATQDWSLAGARPVAFNRAWSYAAPEHGYPAFSLVGTQVHEAAVGLATIPLAGSLVVLPAGSPLPQPGQAVEVKLPGLSGAPVCQAMAGGPMLLAPEGQSLQLEDEDFAGSAPPVTFSQDETFDQNLLPRMAAGLDGEGRLLFAAIDGRHFHRAPGMTLHQSARLMKALGCVVAMNLDGGSSKRMVVEGRMVDLSSTDVQSRASSGGQLRPVHSAIALY